MNGPSLPAVFREVLIDIGRSNFCELACVAFNGDSHGALEPPMGRVHRTFRAALDFGAWRSLGFEIYRRYIDSRFARDPSPTVSVDCSDLIPGLPTRVIRPIRSRFVHRFTVADEAWMRAQRLDVILRFGFNILRGGVLTSARCGVWSYHHGDNRYYRGGPALFWEVVERNPVSGVVLQVLNEELDGGLVICKALFSTTRTPSYTANRFGPYWASEHFVIRKLKEVHEDGWDLVRSRATPSGEYLGKQAIYRVPKTMHMLRWAGARAIASAKIRRRTKGRIPHWQIGVRRSEVPLYEDASTDQLRKFRILESPRGRFWADPFLFRRRGEMWLFFEDFDRQSNRGLLQCAVIHEDLSVGPPQAVLERPYHLSYPCVIQDGDEVYLLPESEAGGGLDLFRVKRFPGEWELVTRLLDFPVVDATPFRHDGRWWMFASPMIVKGHAAQTLLFSAPSIAGPWRHAKCSPISEDVRFARGAGSVIQDVATLIRPSQDTAVDYGRALVFNRIDAFSDGEYRESHTVRVEPTWLDDQVGVHTYNRVDDWEVIDVNLMRRASEVL